jgi:glycosyltransferase involved in cell wall biosynthesis
MVQLSVIPGRFLDHLKNYDIIHFHNETDLTLPLFSYFVKKPKILHCHCLDVSYSFYRSNFLSRGIFKNVAELYIAVSQPISQLLVNLGIPRKKIRVISNGIDIKRFQPQKETKLENLLLFVGRLQPKKGLHVLLKSLDYIKKPVKLIIIGPPLTYCPEYYKEILILVERTNNKTLHKVSYIGVQKTEDMIKWYQKASISICPSLSEPFGIVNLEALSCGTPVVASNVGGIPEVVQNDKNGILVEPNNPIKLANAIEFLLDNEKLRRRFGKEGRRWVVKNFSSQIVAKKLCKVYDGLLLNEHV